MAKKNDDLALLLAGAALSAGAAWLAFTHQSNEQRKSSFFNVLTQLLDERGMRLIEANFGRASGNRAVWSITYETPWSETRLQRVSLSSDVDPYAESAAIQVASALAPA